MQMHISKKNNFKKDLITDHTLIIKEIDRTIKSYNWKFILNELPAGSILVGGYIRDIILGRLNRKIDIDIVVTEKAINFGKKIAKDFQGKFIILDKERDVIRIIFKNISFDIASQIGGSIENDLLRRDFSINAIGFSFDSRKIIDPSNGLKDLQKSLLRSYRNQNLLDDPLRILRCFRFVSELNFDMDLSLVKFIEQNKDYLSQVAVERIHYELKRILEGEKAFETSLLINKFKIFNYFQSYEELSSNNLNAINYQLFTNNEIKEFLPLVLLIEVLTEDSIRKIKFSKSDILNSEALRKWKFKLLKKPIKELSEIERFNLHKDLENVLPALICYLPKNIQYDWLKRWKDKGDKLFHPSNLICGDTLKKHLKIKDGPILGKLISYLSIELAFNRISNFDEAIDKANEWFQQNAPKCD